MLSKPHYRILFSCLISALCGCQNLANVENPSARSYAPLEKAANVDDRDWLYYNEKQVYQRGSFARNPAQSTAEWERMPTTPPLSPGDRVMVSVAEGEEFSGTFAVDVDGVLNLPFLPPLQAQGVKARTLEKTIAAALIEGGFFKPDWVLVSVRVRQWAPIHVRISGAVFQPGRLLINTRKAPEKALLETLNTGDYAPDRLLAGALRAAGGVRPDADLRNVLIERGEQRYRTDLSGIFSGEDVRDLALAAGDRVIVPSTGVFHGALMRPSQITPPGIRVFLSNLTVPALNNASAAVGKHATELPYGTRMLAAAVSANCLGGTQATNAERHAVLVSINPATRKTEVLERNLHDLMRRADDEQHNPYLLPGDAIACYDSGVSNVRDIARTITDVVNPLYLFRASFGLL